MKGSRRGHSSAPQAAKFCGVLVEAFLRSTVQSLFQIRKRSGVEPSMSEMLKDWISEAGDVLDQIFRMIEPSLPDLATFFVLLHFIQDGIGMLVQWTEEREAVDLSWGCGWYLATLFVILNLLGQLGGVGMVFFRFRDDIGCGLLILTVCLQILGYTSRWGMKFLFRKFSLIGALILVLADSLFNGVPSQAEDKLKAYLQLAGRVLLVFGLLAFYRFEWSQVQILPTLGRCGVLTFVAIGYNTEFFASALAFRLIIHTVFVSFDAIDIFGGFVMLVSLGPGPFSLDALQ